MKAKRMPRLPSFQRQRLFPLFCVVGRLRINLGLVMYPGKIYVVLGGRY